MKLQDVSGKINSTPKTLASYFGLTEEVIARMENYSLIRWQDRELIAENPSQHVVTIPKS